jgi:hypothetical protein
LLVLKSLGEIIAAWRASPCDLNIARIDWEASGEISDLEGKLSSLILLEKPKILFLWNAPPLTAPG